MKHLIVISGPTASGKTSLSVALAKRLNTCILSADSRQFYKELSIGTAKPTSEEQDGVKHYFIDSHSVTDEVASAEFEKQALSILETEFREKDVALLTGGSGMFVDALCIGLDDIPTDSELKELLQKEYEASGIEPLLKELQGKDPEYYTLVDKDNAKRILRAVEVVRLTGKKYSELRKAQPAKRPFKVHRFVLNHDREKLYKRINLRVDMMMEAGLLDEVKSVMQYRNLASLNTVGYKEVFEYLDGKTSLNEAIEKIKRNSRRYAKRQLTWFRRHPDSHWINFSNENDMVEEILAIFEKELNPS